MAIKQLRRRHQWVGEIEKWTRKFIKQHGWRTEPEMDEDDLYQECFIKFLHVRKNYPFVNVRHFMSLYMVSVRNLLSTFADRNIRRKSHYSTLTSDDGSAVSFDSFSDNSNPVADIIVKDFVNGQKGMVGEAVELLKTLSWHPSELLRTQDEVLQFITFALDREPFHYWLLKKQLQKLQDTRPA